MGYKDHWNYNFTFKKSNTEKTWDNWDNPGSNNWILGNKQPKRLFTERKWKKSNKKKCLDTQKIWFNKLIYLSQDIFVNLTKTNSLKLS